jgi:gamma-glutamyl hydrolase
MQKVNGILFPGGSSSFFSSNGYADAGDHIYKIAFEMNSKVIYFPLWGTCLGFELLTFLSANRTEHRARCSSQSQALPLEFKPDFQQSRLYANMPYEIEQIFRKEAVTINFHNYCTTEKNMTAFHLNNEWRSMSLNKDNKGFEFISSLEHRQ